MRIGVGYLLQESNTFSPVETHLRDFHPLFGASLLDRWQGTRTEIGAFLDVLEPSGHEIVPLFAGWAMTAGPMSAKTFDQLKTKVTRQAHEDGPFDALLLALHGSLSAAGTDDCDGELLEALREIAGVSRTRSSMPARRCAITRPSATGQPQILSARRS